MKFSQTPDELKTLTTALPPTTASSKSTSSIKDNTHSHIDYGGDDCEHTGRPSRVPSEAELRIRRLRDGD